MTAVIYPTTNLKATEQMIVDRGEGVYVYDSDGKQMIEAKRCPADHHDGAKRVIETGYDQNQSRDDDRDRQIVGMDVGELIPGEGGRDLRADP